MYYVFYIRGEVCVTETGVAHCDTLGEAREFVSRLDVWDNWMIVEGRKVDSVNLALTPYHETKDI